MSRVSISLVALAAAGLLTACGGGSKSSSSGPSPSTVLSGVATKGPLDKAKVTAYRVASNGQRGAVIGQPATTSADGTYSLDLGSYTGPVELEVTVQPGVTTSADEATGQSIALPDNFALRSIAVVAPPTGAGTPKEVHVTPFTELASALAASKDGGLTSTNIQTAASLVSKTYGFDPVSTRPIRFDQQPPATATEPQKRYAMHNAAVSAVAQSAGACAAEPNGGAKLRCAVAELRATLEVATATAGEAKVQVKDQAKVDALAQAMKTVAVSPRNQTGITESHKIVKDLQQLAEVAKEGKVEIAVSTTQSGDDISTKARKFFDNLRANAAALEAGAADEALTGPLKTFGDMVDGDAAGVTSDVSGAILLSEFALFVWNDYRSGLLQSPDVGSSDGRERCRVYRGSFPANLSTELASAQLATNPAEATYVACRIGRDPINGSAAVMDVLFHFSASVDLSSVPYRSASRVVTRQNGGSVVSDWKTGVFSGSVGYVLNDDDALTGLKMVGDLSPALSSSGEILAQKYIVDIEGEITKRAQDLYDIKLKSGSLGIVPVGAQSVSTTLDISPSGATSAVLWDDASVAAQVAASRVELVGRISNAKGQINGRLVIDQLVNRATGGDEDLSGRITFTGDMSVTGVGKLLEGKLVVAPKAQDPETTVVSFDGALSLPNRPKASLEKVSIEVRDDDIQVFSGTYVQNGVTVQFNGQGGAVGNVTFAGVESLVSMTVTEGQNLIEVKVGGTKAATIDQDRSRVTYVDGSFESLL